MSHFGMTAHQLLKTCIFLYSFIAYLQRTTGKSNLEKGDLVCGLSSSVSPSPCLMVLAFSQ